MPFGQRVQDDGVVEALRGGQVPLPAGDRVQVGQCLRQAAELGLQDHLHLAVREPVCPPVDPVAQLRATSRAWSSPASWYWSIIPARYLWIM
jgi:hypothetical protein